MRDRIFHDWVPEKLDFWLILILSVILSMNSGISSAVYNYVVGSQSSTSADTAMTSYAFLCGQACVMPLTLRLQRYTSRKPLLICSFLVVIFFNFILAQTDQPLIMVMASFIIGFTKMISTLIVVLNLVPIIMPKGERYQLYCFYYPISLMFSPLLGTVAVFFADNWNWQLSFHIQNLFLYVGLIMILFLAHGNRHTKKLPLYQYDWIGTVLLGVSLLLISFVLCYGLNEDWLNSTHIKIAIIGALVSTGIFLRRTFRIKRPVVEVSLLGNWKTSVGFFLIFSLCIFYNASTLSNSFCAAILKNNPVETARLNLYVIPGYLIGGVICFLYFRKFTYFKVMAVFACLSFLASNILMYDLTAATTEIKDLYLPMILRGLGTMVSFTAVGLYISSTVESHNSNPASVILIIIRSWFTPLFSAALFSNLIYRIQSKYVYRLAEVMDAGDPLVRSRGNSLVAAVKSQATMLAIRDIYGYLVVFGLVLLIFIIFFPFHGTNKRTVFTWTDNVLGREIAPIVPV